MEEPASTLHVVISACIPTKTLVQSVESGSNFRETYEYRAEVTERIRNTNYNFARLMTLEIGVKTSPF